MLRKSIAFADDSMMKSIKNELRQIFQSKRRLLTPSERETFSQQAAVILSQQAEFQSAKRIALYMSMPDELQTTPIFPMAFAAEKICTVPVLVPKDMLSFVVIHPHTAWKTNRYSILEPDSGSPEHIAPESLDLVLVPLVSFDDSGQRLGMGAGYYDKTFAFRQHRATPPLIGLAFECQRHDKLPTAAHDIGLDAVVTEKTCYRFPKKWDA